MSKYNQVARRRRSRPALAVKTGLKAGVYAQITLAGGLGSGGAEPNGQNGSAS
jgi:hypothetical protein